MYIEFNYKINLHNRFAIKFEPTVSGFSFRRKKTLTAVSISADESALSEKLIIKQEKEEKKKLFFRHKDKNKSHSSFGN